MKRIRHRKWIPACQWCTHTHPEEWNAIRISSQCVTLLQFTKPQSAVVKIPVVITHSCWPCLCRMCHHTNTISHPLDFPKEFRMKRNTLFFKAFCFCGNRCLIWRTTEMHAKLQVYTATLERCQSSLSSDGNTMQNVSGASLKARAQMPSRSHTHEHCLFWHMCIAHMKLFLTSLQCTGWQNHLFVYHFVFHHLTKLYVNCYFFTFSNGKILWRATCCSNMMPTRTPKIDIQMTHTLYCVLMQKVPVSPIFQALTFCICGKTLLF